MNIKEAVSIISRECPCRHDSYDSCGNGHVWGKCCDCGTSFPLENLVKHQQAADKFDEAVSFILALDTSCDAHKPKTKEIKLYASVDSTTGKIWNVGTKEDMDMPVYDMPIERIKVVELAGTYESYEKPKVQKSVDLGVVSFGDDLLIRAGADFYDMGNRPPEIAGKTGRFIFVWEE